MLYTSLYSYYDFYKSDFFLIYLTINLFFAILRELSKMAGGAISGEKGAINVLAKSLEVIPRTLCQNCGCNVIRTMTKLRAKHSEG